MIIAIFIIVCLILLEVITYHWDDVTKDDVTKN